jgi:hypothetical protein
VAHVNPPFGALLRVPDTPRLPHTERGFLRARADDARGNADLRSRP